MGGPLQQLHVIDLTDDSGRFATKMLAELGAEVVRVHPGGRQVSHGPAMRDAAATARGGLLDWWYDGGKRLVPLDLTTSAGASAYRNLASRADLIVETERPGRLAELGVDHADLVEGNQRLVQVSLTPFGRTGPWAQRATSDLVASALSGVLSLSGTPEKATNPFGRQSYHFGSFMAMICGLAGVRSARQTGRGQLVDVSLHETLTSSIENLWFQYWFDELLPIPKVALRQGSLHWLRAYVVTQCKTGWCNVAPVPVPGTVFEWLAEEGVAGASEFVKMDVAEAITKIDDVMALLRSFALTKDSGELWTEAQRRHIAFGEVQTVAQASANPQFEYRHFYDNAADGGVSVARPRHPVVYSATPLSPSPALVAAPTPIDDIVSSWGMRSASGGNGAQIGKPLDGVRILDFTWVLAGPFCCRMLGDLGADIIKLQTAERATLVNSPDFPYFYCWNRSKRSLTLDMKAGGALDIARKLVENADVVIENYSAGVLARWGLDYETVKSWNPRIVYVTMSGCGHDGPWSKVITYAPTIHALCGITYLSNPPGRGDVGPGFSLNDHAAGFMAANSVLAALEAREHTGEGQHVDIAQIEVGAYLIGGAMSDYMANGNEVEPNGNIDPYAAFAVNEVFKTSDGEVAITAIDDADSAKLQATIGGSLDTLEAWCAARTAREAMDTLQAAGIAAGRVQNADHLTNDDEQLKAREFFGTLHSEVFGDRPFDRFPAKWSLSSLEPYRVPPNYLGEHNFEILTELAGMTDEDVAIAIGEGLLS